MYNVKSEKKRLRAELKKIRFSGLDVKEADRLITLSLLSLPETRKAGTVFCYISMGGETDTYGYICELLAAGKKVCAPVCETGGSMTAVELKDIKRLKPGRFGIPEPDGEVVEKSDIDLVIVPGEAYDYTGNRLGRGGGYYDRFLSGISAVKCGICRDDLLIGMVPVDNNDIPVDIVVTQTQIIRINGDMIYG